MNIYRVSQFPLLCRLSTVRFPSQLLTRYPKIRTSTFLSPTSQTRPSKHCKDASLNPTYHVLPSPPPDTSPAGSKRGPGSRFVKGPVFRTEKGARIQSLTDRSLTSLLDALEPRTACLTDSQCYPRKCINGVCQCKLKFPRWTRKQKGQRYGGFLDECYA